MFIKQPAALMNESILLLKVRKQVSNELFMKL